MDAPTSSSNNHNRNSDKKSKTTDGLNAAPEQRRQQPQSLLALPDVANECLCSFLHGKAILNLSTVSVATKKDYGGQTKELTLRWHDDLSGSSLLTLLQRQKRLQSIILKSLIKLLPFLFVPLARNDLCFLRVLELKGLRSSISCTSVLAGMMTQGALPLLERFQLVDCEKRGVEVIMKPFKAGACPYLHTLALPIPFYDTYFDEEGNQDEVDHSDDEQTDKDLEAILEALEGREKLGIPGLKKLQGGDWLDYGTVEVRTRLLRFLLPYLEHIPGTERFHEDWQEDFDDFATVFAEMGAPRLKRFDFPVLSPRLIMALHSMTSLTTLSFDDHPMDNICTDQFIGMIEQHGSSLLPQLKILDLRHVFTDTDSAQRFFTCVGEQGAFLSVEELHAGGNSSDGPTSGFCPSLSFSQGAFAGVQRLILRGVELTQERLAAFCQALEGSPCVKNLTLLDLRSCNIEGPGMAALGELFAKSLLLSLQELNLSDNSGIKSAGLKHLTDGAKVAGVHAAPALAKLLLSRTGIGPSGLNALMSAFEMACFPALEELNLSYNKIFPSGFDCLSQTIRAGHLSILRKLHLRHTELKSSKAAGALAVAIVMHCPKMTTLSLPDTLENNTRETIQGALQERESLEVYFF